MRFRKFELSTDWLRRQKPNANFELTAIIMGIPFARWGARPFIIHPIACPTDCREGMRSYHQAESRDGGSPKNPVQIALQWQRMLETRQAANRAEIARNTGISRARVTQIMNLLCLPEEILLYVAVLTAPDQLRIFSERNLRAILTIRSKAARISSFRKLRGQFGPAS